MKEKKRIKYFDNIKGLLIILVVFSHFLYEFRDLKIIEGIVRMIYLFHMPAFVFISGYFSKSESSSDNKKLFRLFFYYLIANFILMWYSFIMYKTPFNLIEPYYSLWYLIALIVWRKLSNYINISKIILPLSIFVALFIGFFSEVNNVFALSRIISFFPFFILGYKLKGESIKRLLKMRNIFIYIVGLLIILSSLFASIMFVPYISLDDTMMFSFDSYSGLVARIIIFVISLFMILGIILVTPKRKISFITLWGKNSLYIFLYHRIITLIISELLPKSGDTLYYIVLSLVLTIIICLIFGNNKVSKFTNKFYNKVRDIFLENNITTKKVLLIECVVIIIIFTLSVPFLSYVSNLSDENSLFEVMSYKEEKKVRDSVSILFTGDLILLKEQVERGYNKNTKKYNFNSVFDYTRKYIEDADLSIGVFEGPMAGASLGYTTSDFDDGIKLYNNFPDEFGKAVKNAGFDLVTLANNHIFDKGKDGALRTAEKLEDLGLEYTGVYKNKMERENSQIIEKEGLRIGILSYTYGFNYYDENDAVFQDITPVIVDKNSKYFKKVKEDVVRDFERLKNERVDAIIVLPHMGTQFSHDTDSFQDTWNEIFIENGATIILGDHSHAVQPIEFRENKKGEDVIIVNSPGNFVNSYIKDDGDATSMVEIYLDKEDGGVVGSSVIPMWTNSLLDGNYQALPIYDILNNLELKKRISTYELKRVKKVYGIITDSMFSSKLSLDNSEEKLYLSKDGYKRKKVESLNITKEEKNSNVYKKIYGANTICFIGDSVTEGTKNGGYGWFEPLMNNFKNKKVINVSKGGATVSTITKTYNGEKADLYIVAIGANDIRYRDDSICSMDEKEYIKDLKKLINKIPNNKNVDIVFIAPWISLSNDSFISDQELKDKLYDKYMYSLEKFCEKNNYLYINPNKKIKDVFKVESSNKYLIDHIHPNSKRGIYLYSKAVLDASM